MLCYGPFRHDVRVWTTEKANKLGIALRRLREERGITQENLAYRAQITKNQVQLLEAGRGSGRKDATNPSNPRLSTLVGLADGLDLSVSQLLEQAGL